MVANVGKEGELEAVFEPTHMSQAPRWRHREVLQICNIKCRSFCKTSCEQCQNSRCMSMRGSEAMDYVGAVALGAGRGVGAGFERGGIPGSCGLHSVVPSLVLYVVVGPAR
jgi:hypothetical protein